MAVLSFGLQLSTPTHNMAEGANSGKLEIVSSFYKLFSVF